MEKESEKRFYPERPGANIDSVIDILSKEPKYTPTEEERREALTVEEGFTRGVDLYSTFNIENPEEKKVRGVEQIYLDNKVNTLDFFLEYFTLSDEGYHSLRDLGFEPENGDVHEEEVEKFLSGLDYSSINANEIAEIAGNSQKFVEDTVVAQMQENSYESLDGLTVPTKISVVKNPEDLASRMQELRDLKDFLKQYSESETAANSSQVKAVVNMHQRRVNELIADCYPDAIALTKQHKNAPKKESQEAIEKIAKSTKAITFESSDVKESALSRLDKYLNGAGGEIEDGYYSPISDSAEDLADNIRNKSDKKEESANIESAKYGKYEDLYGSVEVNAEELQTWVEKVLSEYEILSDVPDVEYSTDRSGRASDGKWQVVIHPTAASLAVDGAQGTVKIPTKFKRSLAQVSPAGAVPVTNHEIEHVVQWENKNKIGLSLPEVVGVDRSSVYSEAGGIMWETETQQELFGQERGTNVDYISASERKLRGGNYLDCVKAFYDSNMSANPDKEKKEAAKLAANRVLRLFRNEGKLDDEKGFLANSQPLVYLEQELIAQRLKEANKEHLLHYGINLDVLADLHRVGMVDVSKAWIPDKKPSEILEEEIENKFENAK